MRDLLTALADWITTAHYTILKRRLEDNNMTYRLMKRIIETAKKDGTLEEKRESIMDKLDVFLMADRITPEQYQELVELMQEGQHE